MGYRSPPGLPLPKSTAQVLEPGDILYVPRGCLHATSTPDGEIGDEESWQRDSKRGPSFHFTVGLQAMQDTGISATWEAFFGAGDVFRHEHVLEGYYTALGNLVDRDERFRQALPRDFMIGGYNRTWENIARNMFHDLVDEMLDKTSFVRRTQRLVRGYFLKWIERMEDQGGYGRG